MVRRGSFLKYLILSPDDQRIACFILIVLFIIFSYISLKPYEKFNKDILRININLAKEEDLEQIPGIGPKLAKRIVEYRLKNGNFKSFPEIMKVKGIGEEKLKKMLPYLILK